MFRIVLAASLLALVPASGALAEKISTTSCSAATDRTMTKDGKSYSCTSCETCKTTTCEAGGTASCSIETKTSCSCVEATPPAPKASRGTLNKAPNAGVVDLGQRPVKRPQIFKFDGAGGVLKK